MVDVVMVNGERARHPLPNDYRVSLKLVHVLWVVLPFQSPQVAQVVPILATSLSLL